MKKLLLLTILFVLIGLTLPSNGQPFTPRPLDIRPVKAGQPFPFPSGVAMSMDTYHRIGHAYRAADSLAKQSRLTVDSLSYMVSVLDDRIESLTVINNRQADDLQILRIERDSVAAQLELARADARTRELAMERIRKLLPRRPMQRLGTDYPPDQLAEAVAKQFEHLEKRGRRLGTLGLITGAALVLSLLL